MSIKHGYAGSTEQRKHFSPIHRSPIGSSYETLPVSDIVG